MSKFERRNKDFQKGFDLDKLKRKRAQNQILLRKAKREEHTAKKRAMINRKFQDELFEIPQSLTEIWPTLAAERLDSEASLVELMAALEISTHMLDAVRVVRMFLAVRSGAPVRSALNLGLIGKLQALLSQEDQYIVFEAVWCLTNIASEDSEIVSQLVTSGVISNLIELLDKELDEALLDQIIWCLSNIAGDCVSHRDIVINLGTSEKIAKLALAGTETPEVLGNMAWTLSNLARGKPAPPPETLDVIEKAFYALIDCNNSECVKHACWGFSYSTDEDLGRIQAFLNSGKLSTIIFLAQTDVIDVQIPALRIIGNILSSGTEQCKQVLQSDILEILFKLLETPKNEIRKDVLWALSNILANSIDEVDMVMKHTSFNVVLEAVIDPDLDIRKEAIWCVQNICLQGNNHHRMHLYDVGLFFHLINILEQTEDPRILLNLLSAVQSILKLTQEDGDFSEILTVFTEAGGLNRLEVLQEHPNCSVYKQWVEIMNEFFVTEEVRDENVDINVQRIEI